MWRIADQILIPLQLVLAMLGMGATLAPRDFGGVMRHPASIGVGMGLQWLVIPLLAVLVAGLLDASPGWSLGLLLVTVTPGGAFSNLLTHLGRGHLALSISLTVIATLASIVTAPLLLRLLAAAHVPRGFVFPTGRIVYEVTLYLLLPLAAGMVLRRWRARAAPGISRWAIAASLALVLVIAAVALLEGRLRIAAYGWQPPATILGFALLIHVVAAELSSLLRRPAAEVLAIAIEASVRNGGVALLLLRYFFAGQVEQMHALYTVLLYTGLQIWVPLPSILRLRRGRDPRWLRRSAGPAAVRSAAASGAARGEP